MQNVKTMWLCCMIVLTAAIMLILISVMSGTQIVPGVVAVDEEESVFNQTIQQSLSKMSEAIEWLEEENEKDKQQLEDMQHELNSIKSTKRYYEELLTLLVLVDEKKNDEAKELIDRIDYEQLSDSGKALYDGVKVKLKMQ